MSEGIELVDTLLAPEENDEVPELWQIGSRKPKDTWALHMQLAFKLCTSVVRLVTQIVANCSQRVEAAMTGAE